MKTDLDTLYIRWNNSWWADSNHSAEYAKLIIAILHLVRNHNTGLTWTARSALSSWEYRHRRYTEREEMGR